MGQLALTELQLCPILFSILSITNNLTNTDLTTQVKQRLDNDLIWAQNNLNSTFTVQDFQKILKSPECSEAIQRYLNIESGPKKKKTKKFYGDNFQDDYYLKWYNQFVDPGDISKVLKMSTNGYIQSYYNNNNFSSTTTNNIFNYENLSSDNTDNEFEYWPIETRVTMSIIFATLSIIGIIGNLLVVTVVHRVPGMITPTNCYLVSLAISDCMFFVATAPTELSYLHVASSKYIFGQFGCAIFSYLPYLAINTSSMSITAFTIERFIGICYPLRARYICTVKRAKSILFFIWVFGILYNSPWLYLATLKEDMQGQICSFKLARDNWTYKVMFLGDFAAFYLIPMILYIFIYAKITYTLSKRRLKCADVIAGSPDAGVKSCHGPTTYDTSPKNGANFSIIKNREYFVNTGNRKNSTRGNIQVIKMLSVVVFIFAFCWLPYRAMVMYNSFNSSSSRWDPDWYIFLSKTLIFFNCSVNPILYNLMSSRFRNAFKRLLNNQKCLDNAKNQKKSLPILTRFFNQESKNSSLVTTTTVRSMSHGSVMQGCKTCGDNKHHDKCIRNTSLPLKNDVESAALLNHEVC